jgi:acetoin utilization deacetylase AcuC-like enzyme
MPLILISSERFAEHQTPPGHPERSERATVMEAAATRWRETGGQVVAPREATKEQLRRVHDAQYIQRISETAGQATALDPDTYTSPESYEIALLAAGSAVDAVERVMGDSHTSAFALVRPPGHHAERGRAMGFCLFNNIAVAAAHARTLGAARVAIVDFDVHHGNGTQHIFDRDPSVLYISTHQYPYYPGTGAADEIGTGDGTGFTVNVPMESGAVDGDFQVAFDEIIVPVLRQFKPDVLLVSAGFDAHERDPLATMRATAGGFGAMTAALRGVAEETCHGRMALVTEGGYDLQALAASIDQTVAALAGPFTPSPGPVWPAAVAAPVASTRGRTAADRVKRAIAPFWKVK